MRLQGAGFMSLNLLAVRFLARLRAARAMAAVLKTLTVALPNLSALLVLEETEFSPLA